jgi:peptidoglycan-associated lipoprotein
MRRNSWLSAWLLLVSVLSALALSACKPKYPKCDNDKDCKEREYCVNGQCQQCRDDKDCKAGEKCNQGRCEAQSSMSVRCSDDLQCPDGQSCIDGMCKPCASDGECGPGGKCDKGRCARGTAGKGDGQSGCNFEPVFFDFNENVLSTEATAAIDHNAECLKAAAPASLTLTGHTDPRGTEEYNLALSDKRAQAVRDRLQRVGAQTSSVKLIPKGELEAGGTDESGWAKDRRVDFGR